MYEKKVYQKSGVIPDENSSYYDNLLLSILKDTINQCSSLFPRHYYGSHILNLTLALTLLLPGKKNKTYIGSYVSTLSYHPCYTDCTLFVPWGKICYFSCLSASKILFNFYMTVTEVSNFNFATRLMMLRRHRLRKDKWKRWYLCGFSLKIDKNNLTIFSLVLVVIKLQIDRLVRNESEWCSNYVISEIIKVACKTHDILLKNSWSYFNI